MSDEKQEAKTDNLPSRVEKIEKSLAEMEIQIEARLRVVNKRERANRWYTTALNALRIQSSDDPEAATRAASVADDFMKEFDERFPPESLEF